MRRCEKKQIDRNETKHWNRTGPDRTEPDRTESDRTLTENSPARRSRRWRICSRRSAQARLRPASVPTGGATAGVDTAVSIGVGAVETIGTSPAAAAAAAAASTSGGGGGSSPNGGISSPPAAAETPPGADCNWLAKGHKKRKLQQDWGFGKMNGNGQTSREGIPGRPWSTSGVWCPWTSAPPGFC